ncbi:MAG: hypothetical protein J6Q53_05745 [Oscillospiraceae bacterium]|nr:hypothetical protein [Oscillospiraceae bacterium]
MKKLLCLFLAILIVVLSLSACSETPAATEPSSQELARFEILELGGYDHISGANHSDDFRLTYDEEAKRPADKQKINIIRNGTEYELPYYQTRGSYLYHDTRDIYRIQTTEKLIEIELNRYTGRVDFYSWYDRDYLHAVPSDELTREECLTIARAYLGDYIEDSAQYDLIADSYSTASDSYLFTFSRLVDGVETYDRAKIRVTVYGDVITHSFGSLGSMRDAILPTQETMDDIQAGLDERLEKIYAPLEDKYNVSYELNKEEFLRLADGTYALKYDFAVHAAPKNSEQSPWVEGTHLLVRLN